MTIAIWTEVFRYMQEFFRTASVILFLHCFHDSRFQWNWKKATLLIGLAALGFVSFLLGYELIFGIFMMLYGLAALIVVIYDYSGNKLKGFLLFVCIYVFFALINALISIVAASYLVPGFNMETTQVNASEEFFYLCFSSLYFLIIFLLLHFGVHKRNIVMACGKKNILFFVFYFVLMAIVCGVFVSYEKGHEISLVVLISSFILVTMLLPVFVYSLRISVHYRRRNELQELYLKSELEHFRQYQHAQEETRRFRHDIRNNLLCMNEMVSSGDREKLMQYLKDLLEITDSLSFRYVSGDALLDSILNSKAQVIEGQNIRFELDGVLAGGLDWKPMDICAVFANAIDNAIEACQKVSPEDRYISMHIKSTPQFWLISIENSVAKAVDTNKLFLKNSGYTSKSDSSNHGIGTYSMKHTVESYGAIMQAECTEQAFTLEIIIDKTK